MIHPFFDELRVEGARMPNGKDFPLLFDFTREGRLSLLSHPDFANTDAIFVISAELSVRPDLIRQLVPPHCETELRSRSIELDKFVPIPLEQMKISLD